MAAQKQFDIEELARLLEFRKGNGQPTVLLLGSRAGALYRSQHFHDSLQKFSYRDFNNLSRIEKFSECYSILMSIHWSETDIHNFLRTSLRDISATKGDAYITELVKQGYFDEIISTNVDDMLEQSFLRAEMKEHRDFEVTIPIRDSDTFREKSLPYRIIKIFGDFGSNMYTIKERSSYLDNNQEIKSAVQRILARDMIIVGIDPIWDEYIIKAIPAKAGTIFFINEEARLANNSVLKERKTQYIWGSYDYFARELCNALNVSPGLPMDYQFANDILVRLSDISSRLQEMQDEQRVILNAIEKIQKNK